ncbi:MAG: hypothetical protein ABL925_07250, partial [Methylococcales bacterium]
MKNILLVTALLLALPMLANAEEAMLKEQHMQNTNPAPAKPRQQVSEQAPEHVMRNSSPEPKQVQQKEHAPGHVM